MSSQNRSGPEDELLELRMVVAIPSENLLDLPFVVGIGELRVAAKGIGLGEWDGIVGMISVSGTTAGDDEMTYSGLHGGAEDILRTADIDRVFELAPVRPTWMDDRRQVNDGVSVCFPDQSDDRGIADISRHVANMRKSLAGRSLLQIECGHAKELRLLGKSTNDLRTEIAAGTGNEDRSRIRVHG